MNTTPLTFGSLFAGIGGFDLGFERAGMTCKWQVEIDDYANRVLAKHWPNVHRERDIRTAGRHNLERVDVICGGFPCQDISYAGQGAGLDGERSGLFFEAVRVVRELRPRIVVLENVAALLTRGLDRVLGTLAEIGFDTEWHCIPAAAVGAPHIRDRVFVIGTDANATEYGRRQRNENSGRCREGTGEREECRSRSVRENVADADEQHGDNGRHGSGSVCGKRSKQTDVCGSEKDVANARARRRCEKLHEQIDIRSGQETNCNRNQTPEAKGRGNVSGVFTGASSSGGEQSDWITEPDVGRVANGVPARVDRLRGLGNAVVPQVAEWIGKRIVETVG